MSRHPAVRPAPQPVPGNHRFAFHLWECTCSGYFVDVASSHRGSFTPGSFPSRFWGRVRTVATRQRYTPFQGRIIFPRMDLPPFLCCPLIRRWALGTILPPAVVDCAAVTTRVPGLASAPLLGVGAAFYSLSLLVQRLEAALAHLWPGRPCCGLLQLVGQAAALGEPAG